MKKRRSRFGRVLLTLLGLLLAYGGYLYTLDESKMPALKDGDLIFQTTFNSATPAIGLASSSWYIHTGIIKHTDKGLVVVHAAEHVEEWPLSVWIDGGVLKRFAIYRYKDLTDTQAKQVLEAARHYYGRAYDHYFSFHNDSIYCSELEYLAFKDAGIPLGHPQVIGTLNINNRYVKQMIEQRWQHYPDCEGKGYDFETCYKVIMEGELITPAAVAYDQHLTRIFSNYPW